MIICPMKSNGEQHKKGEKRQQYCGGPLNRS